MMLLALAIVPLAACTPTSVAVQTKSGAPAGYHGNDNLFNGRPVALWLEGGGLLGVVTYGSKACPPVPTSISDAGDNVVTIEFAKSPNSPCPMELAATTFKFEPPAGIDPSAPATATLTFDDGREYSVQVQG